MKIKLNHKRNIFSIPLRLALVLIQIYMLVGVLPANSPRSRRHRDHHHRRKRW